MRTALIALLTLLNLLFCSLSYATNWCNESNNVACFLMEDSTTESNESANSSDGLTVSGGDTIPQDTDRKFGDYSRDFDYSDQDTLYQADSLSTDLSGANQQISITAWVKYETSSASFEGVVTKYDYGTNDRQYQLTLYQSRPRILLDSDGLSGSEACTGGDTVRTGSWDFIAGTYDDVNLKIYHNGVLVGNCANTTGIYDGSSNFSVGCYYNSGAYDSCIEAKIDDVGVFDTALSATDINDIMDNGLVPEVITLGNTTTINNATINSATIN